MFSFFNGYGILKSFFLVPNSISLFLIVLEKPSTFKIYSYKVSFSCSLIIFKPKTIM